MNERIQVVLSPDAYDRLMVIKEQTNSSSNAEVVRQALRVYEWAVECEKCDLELAAVKDGKISHIVRFL